MSSATVYDFDYNMIEPKIEVVKKVPTKARIIFSPKYFDSLQAFVSRIFGRQIFIQEITRNPFVEVTFSNHKAKDSFIFITKAFNTKKHLKSTAYVSNL